MDNERTTCCRLRTENENLKSWTKELKKELGKMKDLFSSEQLNAIKHRLPHISNAMNEGKELLKQNTPKLGGRGIKPPPPPRGERPNGSLTQWSVTPFGFKKHFAGSGNGCVLIRKKVHGVGARRDGWSRPLPLGAPRPMIFK